jgi:hypothetical protein
LLRLGRAVLIEVVEFAAGEELGAAPLAVYFLNGAFDPISRQKRRRIKRTALSRALRRPFLGGSPLVRGVDNQEFNSMIQRSTMQKKILRGLLVYAQLTWAHSLSSRAKQRNKNSITA